MYVYIHTYIMCIYNINIDFVYDVYAHVIIYEHVYVVPEEVVYLYKSTRQIVAGRRMLLGEDHDLGRGS